MMIIQLQHVKKYYGADLVLSDVSFEIGETEKVGLIGRNGTGKTTILQLLARALAPDEGEVFVRKGATIGLLAQVPAARDGATLYDVLAEVYEQARGWEREMKELEGRMSDPSVCADEREMQALLNQYGQLQERFERAGGYEMEASIRRVAAGMGIAAEQFGRPFASLSGGEKTKAGLASLLLQRPDILLLDEPTNHLDMAAIEWLEAFLGAYSGAVVIVSHDRYFLDRVARKIIEVEDGEAFVYNANYSGYQKEKEARLLRQFADYQEQQKKIKKMQETIKQLIEWGNRANPPNPGFHRRAASMQKALDRIVRIRRPILERRAIDLALSQEDRSGKQVIMLERVFKSFGGRELLRGANALLLYGERAALMGGNGAGKSTLMKMIIGELSCDAGEIRLGSRADIGYLAQEEAPPADRSTVLRYFCDALAMEEGKARGELAGFLFYGADVFKQVAMLSGGEWSRLRLALLMYRKPNLLILDEPTNHLDIDSREALEEALESFPGTLLVISHDRYFINRVAHKLWLLDRAELTVHIGNYEECREKLQALLQRSGAGTETAKPDVTDSKVLNPKAMEPDVTEPCAVSGLPERTRTKRSALPARRSAAPPETVEEEIAAVEEQLRLMEEEMVRLSSCPAEAADWPRLLEAQTKLRQELDELYHKWLEAES